MQHFPFDFFSSDVHSRDDIILLKLFNYDDVLEKSCWIKISLDLDNNKNIIAIPASIQYLVF